MPVSDLTHPAQDYLKLIWTTTEWTATPITVTAIAERMGVRASTASDGIKKLTEQGLITHAPYGKSIELTEAGRRHAVEMVRRHRLLETFLVQTLGYRWDEVHDEAEVLEHAVSETMIERIDALLGHPTRDPHGDPIPAADGQPQRPEGIPLRQVSPESEATIVRISDADPAMLRYFSDIGLTPNTQLTVRAPHPYTGTTTVSVSGRQDNIDLGPPAAEAIWVLTP